MLSAFFAKLPRFRLDNGLPDLPANPTLDINTDPLREWNKAITDHVEEKLKFYDGKLILHDL